MATITIKTDSCKGCGLCVDAFPKNLIRIAEDKINAKGHHPAETVNIFQCVGCMSCATMCPDCVITVER